MSAKAMTASLQALVATPVEVEVGGRRGTPILLMIGLPGKMVDEARERISSAIQNCGVRLKSKRTVVNLAPADLPKHGSQYELAIAVALLAMYEELPPPSLSTLWFGELSLEGELKPIRGALPLVLEAKRLGFQRVVLPAANAGEVGVVDGIALHQIEHLQELLIVKSPELLPRVPQIRFSPVRTTPDLALDEIRGQVFAKRALEIAAAGWHNVLMIGPPGAGKSMLAKAFQTLLPPLTEAESVAVTNIHSVVGLTHDGLVLQRPFRAPHHTISLAGFIGGGPALRPGEISLAHRGVLFLDELAEFHGTILETLRQPLEDKVISLARANGVVTYPADCLLLAAMNPCPCGYWGATTRVCHCSKLIRERYSKRLSGPLLDRIELCVRVQEVESKVLDSVREASQLMSTQHLVWQAAEIRRKREWRFSNVSSTGPQRPRSVTDILERDGFHREARQQLQRVAATMKLSARSYAKTARVARTIADLEGELLVGPAHVLEAAQYRSERL